MGLLGGEYEEVRIEVEERKKGVSVEREEEGEEEEIPVKGGRRRRVVIDAEEEAEDDEEVKGKGKGKGKAPSKKRKSPTPSPTEEEEEDDDDEEEPAPPIKRSRPQRAAAAAKPIVAKDASFKPLLAHKWDLDTGADPTDWWMSEKLDGVRAIWHGNKGTFLSREGNPFYAPAWFTKRLPRGNVILDGELFTQRGGFQDCVSIVRTQNRPDRWKFSVSYQIFDCPSMSDSPFEDRLRWLKEKFQGKAAIKWVKVLDHEVCEGKEHLLERLEEVCALNGEGLMLRQPGSYYVQGRARSLLKVKKFLDADAVVRAHEGGSGKNTGLCGALRVEMLDAKGKPTGKLFKIGTGLSDAQRKKPPKIGAVVIYRYQELSNSGEFFLLGAVVMVANRGDRNAEVPQFCWRTGGLDGCVIYGGRLRFFKFVPECLIGSRLLEIRFRWL
jgi:DNA ligase-1